MRREPSLTFGGALALLGHYQHGGIGKLDKLLGGAILAAGAGAGLAIVGAPVLAPLASFVAVWGWVEQKNEALKLLRQALDAATGRLIGACGLERTQLIAAAHTTIVVSAFFETFRGEVGKERYKDLQITSEEMRFLVTGESFTASRERILEALYTTEVPVPSPARGYVENILAVRAWMLQFSEQFEDFINGLQAAKGARFSWAEICGKAVNRYKSHYLALAATVPEFMVWAMLGEHAATRSAISNIQADIAGALDANRGALARVEALLALTTQSGEVTDLCSVVERANRGVLDQQIVPMDVERYGVPVDFPSVGKLYINPRYRITMVDSDTRSADETWWEGLPRRNDIDLTLAAHVMTPDATRLPLLLLGDPGAGKSLLTKVFAARLPASAYIVVRVPLRRVGANAPIMDQVQEALDIATHRRVDWGAWLSTVVALPESYCSMV